MDGNGCCSHGGSADDRTEDGLDRESTGNRSIDGDDRNGERCGVGSTRGIRSAASSCQPKHTKKTAKRRNGRGSTYLNGRAIAGASRPKAASARRLMAGRILEGLPKTALNLILRR